MVFVVVFCFVVVGGVFVELRAPWNEDLAVSPTGGRSADD